MNEKNDNEFLEEVGKSVLNKFVNEEIMTKSELDNRLDLVMSKYTNHIEAKFDEKFASMEMQLKDYYHKTDLRYNWIIGLVITAAVSIIGLVLKLH